MNRLPWARLMMPMMPKIRVSPLEIRNSSNPYCSPFRIWAKRPARSIEDVFRSDAAAESRPPPQPAPTLRGGREHEAYPLPPRSVGEGWGGGRDSIVANHRIEHQRNVGLSNESQP